MTKLEVVLFLIYIYAIVANQEVLKLADLEQLVFRNQNFTSVLAVWFKGDLKQIQEFVAFHFIQGFQSFSIYDDGNEISKHSFGKLAKYVEVKTVPGAKPGPQYRIGRQIGAFRDAFVQNHDKKMIIGMWDADEYVYSNDYPKRLVPQVALESGKDESALYCPRFGLKNMKKWNPNELIISQFTARCPFKNESWDRKIFPDCQITSTEPRGVCFPSTSQKAIYVMENLPFSVTNHVSIHGVVRKVFHNYTSWRATESRLLGQGGLACNHYFALDDIEKKILKHEDVSNSRGLPTFYEVYAKSEQVQQYYSMYEDVLVKDLFGAQVKALIAEAY
jgi:hypothetical protein